MRRRQKSKDFFPFFSFDLFNNFLSFWFSYCKRVLFFGLIVSRLLSSQQMTKRSIVMNAIMTITKKKTATYNGIRPLNWHFVSFTMVEVEEKNVIRMMISFFSRLFILSVCEIESNLCFLFFNLFSTGPNLFSENRI